jgi:hypothetical protein
MSPYLLGLLSALVAGVAASLYFWLLRRPADECAEGILCLNAMRWREFAGLVLEMLYRRGYAAANPHPLGSGAESDILLTRGDGRCVLSCKHGSAYRLGRGAVDELAGSVGMNAAAHGIMVTPGSFAPDAREQARQQRIELIDGSTLWPEIASLLPESLLGRVQAKASTRAWRGIGFSWLAALATGAVVAVLLPAQGSDTRRRMPAAVAVDATPKAAATAHGAEAVNFAAAPSPKQIEQHRKDAAGAIAALPGIERALWSTRSTLSVDVGDDHDDHWDGICGILDRYQELRATRVQINPPPGSEAPVRFRQCHAY